MRKPLAGTGWKMNHLLADTAEFAARLGPLLPTVTGAIDVFVLPPFTALQTARDAFASLPVAIGAQNVHWSPAGAWTGEISASMLADVGCRYVALAHSERLRHFAETYELVAEKARAALNKNIVPIICLGEAQDEKSNVDAVLTAQLTTALSQVSAAEVARTVLAYEPRWAIGGAAAATPEYIAERHASLRSHLRKTCGAAAADTTRIIYGGAVTPANGAAIAALADVDGLFVGRAAWQPEGLAKIIEIVIGAAMAKGVLT